MADRSIRPRGFRPINLFGYIVGVSAHRYDSAYKYLFSSRRIFHQLLVSFVDEPFVASLTVEDLQAIDKSFISEEMINRESDIIYRVKKEGLEIYKIGRAHV